MGEMSFLQETQLAGEIQAPQGMQLCGNIYICKYSQIAGLKTALESLGKPMQLSSLLPKALLPS